MEIMLIKLGFGLFISVGLVWCLYICFLRRGSLTILTWNSDLTFHKYGHGFYLNLEHFRIYTWIGTNFRTDLSCLQHILRWWNANDSNREHEPRNSNCQFLQRTISTWPSSTILNFQKKNWKFWTSEFY